jgi:hypothetical protein
VHIFCHRASSSTLEEFGGRALGKIVELILTKEHEFYWPLGDSLIYLLRSQENIRKFNSMQGPKSLNTLLNSSITASGKWAIARGLQKLDDATLTQINQTKANLKSIEDKNKPTITIYEKNFTSLQD